MSKARKASALIRLLLALVVVAASAIAPVAGREQHDCQDCAFCVLGGEMVPCCEHHVVVGASDCLAVNDECIESGGFCYRNQ